MFKNLKKKSHTHTIDDSDMKLKLKNIILEKQKQIKSTKRDQRLSGLEKTQIQHKIVHC